MAIRGKKKTSAKRMSIRERAKKRAEEREKQNTGGGWLNIGDGVEFFSHEKGRNKIDILPYVVTDPKNKDAAVGELWYQKTVWIHYGIGVDEKSYVCPLKTMGKPCPICAHAKTAELEEDEIRALRPRERELYNIYDYKDKKVKLWTLSYHCFGRQLEEEIREGEEEWAGFADLEGGFTLIARFGTEKLGKNEYLKVNRIDFKERTKSYDESILEEVLDLDTIVKVVDYSVLESAFLDKPVEEEEAEEDDNVEEESIKKKKNKRKEEPEEEEEEETEEESEEDDADEDEDDEDNDDEEDDVEEEEEEEEPPPKKPKKADKKKEVKESPGKKTKGKCPHGHKFGKDCDSTDDCDECELWDLCLEAKESD